MRLRYGAYNIFKLSETLSAELIANAKYESARENRTKKGMLELSATPIIGWLGEMRPIPSNIGRNALGNYAQQPWLTLAPLATFGLEAGKTFEKGNSLETNDQVLRLKTTLRLDGELPAIAAAMGIPKLGLALQAIHWRLPKEIDKEHTLARAGVSFGITNGVSFDLSYSVGRDSPTFIFTRTKTAGIGIKF